MFKRLFLTICILFLCVSPTLSQTFFSDNLDYYYTQGKNFNKVGQHEEALKAYNKALEIYIKRLGPYHSSVAKTYCTIAKTYYDLSKYEDALTWYSKALNIYEKNLGIVPDYANCVNVYNNIAGIYRSQGKYKESLKYSLRANDICKKHLFLDHPYTANTYNNIALVYKNQGQYEDALDWYFKALQIKEKKLGKDHNSTAITYNNIAVIYNEQGEYEDALKWYFKALEAKEQNSNPDYLSIATTYNNIATLYIDQKKNEDALQLLFNALEIEEKELGKDHPGISVTYNNIACAYRNQVKFKDALKWYFKALEIEEKKLGKNHPTISVTYNNIADIYDLQGKHQKAANWSTKAFNNINNTANYQNIALIASNIAILYKKSKHYEFVRTYYNEAIKALEDLRYYSSVQTGKERVSTELLDYFYGAIDSSFELSDIEGAFKLSERAKARLLIQSIAGNDAKYSAGISKEDLEKLNSLENQKEKNQKLCIGQNLNSGFQNDNLQMPEFQRTKSCEDFQNLRNQLESFKHELDKKYPKYKQLRFPEAASYDEIAGILKKPEYSDTALIEYFVGNNNLYIWVLSKNGIEGVKLNLTKEEIKELVNSFNDSFKAAGSSDAINIIDYLENFNIDSAKKLYQYLIKPVSKYLKDKNGNYKYKNLTIIPDNILFYLPFEALVASNDFVLSENKDNVAFSEYKEVPFLIKEVNINYLPSASMLKILNKPKKKSMQKELLIVANPDLSYLDTEEGSNQRSLTLPVNTRNISITSDLKFAEEEGKYISNIFNNKNKETLLLLKQKATEEAIKPEMGNYKNYHFSTHGILNDRDPYFSGILLSRKNKTLSENDKEKGMDGILYAYELIGLDINADTVVLSACDTGLGKLEGGEGIIGLSRSFLISGADNLVMSLWKVNDNSSMLLMKDFYDIKNNDENINNTEALRNAKLKLIGTVNPDFTLFGEEGLSYSHPYFWAPFILSGKWR
ncbi:MAG: CHAT domain-containing tetratricopeptide repeat protein [Cyanobacteriota bacterium]